MYLHAETYPVALLNDAIHLLKQAQAGKLERSNDGRDIPSLSERASARAAIFTSFNFLEGLLIELAQDRIKTGPVHCMHCNHAIQDDLKNARAEISRTLKDWPMMLIGKCLLGRSEFGLFRDIRVLRNHLIHPKYETYGPKEPTQDKLLKSCNASEAARILTEICKMAKVLYQEFGKGVPTEVEGVIGKAIS